MASASDTPGAGSAFVQVHVRVDGFPQPGAPAARGGLGGYRSRSARSKAIITVAHAILVINWHVLATGKPYDDLGADYFDRRADPDREAQRLITRLQALGKHVTVEDAA